MAKNKRKQEMVDVQETPESAQVIMINGASTLTEFRDMANAMYDMYPDPDNVFVGTSEEKIAECARAKYFGPDDGIAEQPQMSISNESSIPDQIDPETIMKLNRGVNDKVLSSAHGAILNILSDAVDDITNVMKNTNTCLNVSGDKLITIATKVRK